MRLQGYNLGINGFLENTDLRLGHLMKHKAPPLALSKSKIKVLVITEGVIYNPIYLLTNMCCCTSYYPKKMALTRK